VTARSSFSGTASILRRHTNDPCSSLSVSFFAGEDNAISPYDVEYMPPGTKINQNFGQKENRNSTLDGCIAALLKTSAARLAQTQGLNNNSVSWTSSGSGDVARALDCPKLCLNEVNVLDRSTRGAARGLKNGENTKKKVKAIRHCPSPPEK
jgi:hypothetical protein